MKSRHGNANSPRPQPFTHRGSLVAAVAQPLWQAVAAASGLGEPETTAAIDDGAVYVDGRRCRDRNLQLQVGQAVVVQAAAPAQRRTIGGGELHVVYRDRRLLVVDKPAGLPTQPPPRGGDALSLRVAKLLGERAYLGEVHRLDRDASGLVAYALDKPCAAALAGQFRDHSARRHYLAVVRTQVAVGNQVIDEPIAQAAPGVMTTAATGVPAATAVRCLGFDAAAALALLELRLQTGRSHQIRVHLAWAVGPIVGDRLYGDALAPQTDAAETQQRIALHGGYLGLRHPDLGPLAWTVAPPADFWPPASGPLAAGSPLQVPAGWPAPPPT